LRELFGVREFRGCLWMQRLQQSGGSSSRKRWSVAAS
jgi:hypothetical protein